MTALGKLEMMYRQFFEIVDELAGDWLMGLVARLAFSSVLLAFFLNSAATKLGSGFPGLLIPAAGAYAQILPSVAEAAGYDVSKIALFPYGLIAFAGTYAEILLPLMILLGLFTRGASLAMIGFIAVMTIVDIAFHGVDATTIGMAFDRVQNSPIADQRVLWVVPLIYLALNGAGRFSVDTLLVRWRRQD